MLVQSQEQRHQNDVPERHKFVTDFGLKFYHKGLSILFRFTLEKENITTEFYNITVHKSLFCWKNVFLEEYEFNCSALVST